MSAQPQAQLQSESFGEVRKMLTDAVNEGVFPGAVLLVGRNGSVLFHESFGRMSYAPRDGDEATLPMSPDTVFDVAAITNVLVSTTMCMKLVESNGMRLEDRVSRWVQGFSVYGKSGITIDHLLTHTSGLANWHPYYEELIKANRSRIGALTSRGAREYVINAINRSYLKYESGTKQIYSDIGFILLGQVIETMTGLSLDKIAAQEIFRPLGMRSTSYVDLEMLKRRGIAPVTDVIAPTEECPWRKRVLCGEVHDDNAWVMGGVAGHAGVFSTAADLHRFASELLDCRHGRSGFLKAETIRRFWEGEERGSWRRGWELPSKENGLLDTTIGQTAVGHSGFTGCSLWIDPETGLDIVLLSNRVHPSRSNKKIYSFRPALYQAVLEAALS